MKCRFRAYFRLTTCTVMLSPEPSSVASSHRSRAAFRKFLQLRVSKRKNSVSKGVTCAFKSASKFFHLLHDDSGDLLVLHDVPEAVGGDHEE